jgi:uridine kinase
MTTTAEQTSTTKAPEREEAEQDIYPLLLAMLAGRREERGDRGESLIEHPLLLAMLAGRREERGEGLIEHPLLLAMLARR